MVETFTIQYHVCRSVYTGIPPVQIKQQQFFVPPKTKQNKTKQNKTKVRAPRWDVFAIPTKTFHTLVGYFIRIHNSFAKKPQAYETHHNCLWNGAILEERIWYKFNVVLMLYCMKNCRKLKLSSCILLVSSENTSAFDTSWMWCLQLSPLEAT